MIIAPKLGYSTEYSNTVRALSRSPALTPQVSHVWGNPIFWFCILVIPVFCLLRDFAWKSYVLDSLAAQADAVTVVRALCATARWLTARADRKLFRPEAYHIVQEIQVRTLSLDPR